MPDLIEEFRKPPARYRGKPFWAWNGELSADELRRQIRVMNEMGLGGFFMHSRVGLNTDYLSEEWFRMVRACIDEAENQGMEAWLYDEDRWPSGAGGGYVTRHEKYRRRSLVMTLRDAENLDPEMDYLALFAGDVAERSVRNLRRLEDLDAARELAGEDRTILAFSVKIDDPSPWYNGYTYLDTLNQEAVQKFIEVTHESYLRQVGDHFGEIVPGIFTDEPNYGTVMESVEVEGVEGTAIPWSVPLPETFRERYGYDLMEYLPEVFLDPDGDPISQVRWHYMDCITHMFTEAFARQIGDWCEANDLLHTGHVLEEPTLASQTRVVGSAMRFYEHMQAPGMDCLTEHRPEYGTAKQCSSAQRQMGRRWVLSETYGCTGWDFPFEGHKAVGDWQAALGVNLRCQHLSWYTMAGQAKRDYPASIHYQSPWWRFYDHVEDYFARVNSLLSKGNAERSVLVIHPVESVWALAGQDWEDHEIVQEMDAKHRTLRRWLLEEHIDFDYGDEGMLEEWGEVMADEQNPQLRLCQAHYKTALVPPMVTMRRTTVELLEQFAAAGGNVIFCDAPPTHVDADVVDPEVFEFVTRCIDVAFERTEIVDAVGAASRTVSIRKENGGEHSDVLYQLRHHDGNHYLFICNTNREETAGPLTVEVSCAGPVQRWDAENGQRYQVEAEKKESGVRFSASLPASGSALFVLGRQDENVIETDHRTEIRREELGEDGWTIQLSEPNVLVLDYVSFRVDGGKWHGPDEVLKADQKIRDRMGVERRGGRMVQPWKRQNGESGPRVMLELASDFQIDTLPEGPMELALEQPNRYTVEINGHKLLADADCGWWVDRAIRTLPLDPTVLREGKNTLKLQGPYDQEAGLEAVYLLGDFAVTLMDSEPYLKRSLDPGFGDWTRQGMPFYSGAMTYRKKLELEKSPNCSGVRVAFPDFRGACARVLIDGETAGIAGWPPYEVDITEHVGTRKEIELAVEVISHRRNTFGPLHNIQTRPEWTGPAQFVSAIEQWQGEYNLVPTGCMVPPVLCYYD